MRESIFRTFGPTRANKPDGYLIGSYRIGTALEPNSSRLTSFKVQTHRWPREQRGPMARLPGLHQYSSINPSSANVIGIFTPPRTVLYPSPA
jgi:hypothetical protein